MTGVAMLYVVLVLFAVAFATLSLSLRALAITGVPVKAADPEAVSAALDLLELRDGEVFVELGCGTGEVLRAARRRADVRALGFELNPFAWAMAWARSLGDRKVSVRFGDFRRARWAGASAAYAYLMPGAMAAVGEVAGRELAEGGRLVSADFAVPGWTPRATREVGPLRQPLFLYRVERGGDARGGD